MASWGIALYNRLVADGLARGGQGGVSRNGNPLPVTTPAHQLVVLAAIHDELVKAISHLCSGSSAKLVDFADVVNGYTDKPSVSFDVWVTLCRPIEGSNGLTRNAPRLSKGAVETALAEHGIVLNTGVGYRVETRQQAAVSNIANKSDRCYQLAAAAQKAGRVQLGPDEVKEWWSAVYQLFIAVEVGQEIPTPGLFDRIVGGIKYAARGTAEWVSDEAVPAVSELAGQLAAGAGKAIGQGIGAGTKGFFETAGLTAWIVVIAAVWIWMA